MSKFKVEVKEGKTKQIDKMVMGTRNKLILYYSKLFGNEKTNVVINKTFSSIPIIQKLLMAEEKKFAVAFNPREKEGNVATNFGLQKQILNPRLDSNEYEEKYWNTVRENLLLSYKEEDVNAIVNHYNIPMLNGDQLTIFPYILITDYFSSDETKKIGISIESSLSGILRDSTMEIDDGGKIKTFKQINGEEILGIFLDSLIEVFGDLK